jgi:hypothetical protein
MNDAQGSLGGLDVGQDRAREHNYVKYTRVVRPEELETRRLAKLTANGDDEICPACNLEMGPGRWQILSRG